MIRILDASGLVYFLACVCKITIALRSFAEVGLAIAHQARHVIVKILVKILNEYWVKSGQRWGNETILAYIIFVKWPQSVFGPLYRMQCCTVFLIFPLRLRENFNCLRTRLKRTHPRFSSTTTFSIMSTPNVLMSRCQGKFYIYVIRNRFYS